jgi:hypothetical protein
MATQPDPCALLEEARQAKHDFLRGQSISEFRDQNGESVKYRNFATLQDLNAYIADLEGQCNPGYARARRNRPLGFIF